MRGLRSSMDLYAPVRATIRGARLDRDEVAVLMAEVGNQRRRLFFLGDRLLDRLEARMLRDQDDLPPGLNRLVNEYRSLFRLAPKNYRTTFSAHEAVLDMQGRLTIKALGAVE